MNRDRADWQIPLFQPWLTNGRALELGNMHHIVYTDIFLRYMCESLLKCLRRFVVDGGQERSQQAPCRRIGCENNMDSTAT